MDGVKALGSTRMVTSAQVEQAGSPGTLLGLTIGNMVADIYERAAFLGVEPDLSTLRIEVAHDDLRVEGNPATHQIRAYIEGTPA